MYFREYIRFPEQYIRLPEQLSLRTPLDNHHSIYLNSEFCPNKNTTLSVSVYVDLYFCKEEKVPLNKSETYLKPSQTSEMEPFVNIDNR